MKVKWFSRLPPFLAVTLLAVLFGFDFLFFLNRKFPSSIVLLREFFILFVVVAWIPVLKRIYLHKTKEVTAKLKSIYLTVAALCVFLFATNRLFERDVFRLSDSQLFSSFNFFLLNSLSTVGISLLLVGALLVVKDLIYFKRRRSTPRNFYFLVGFLMVQIFLELFSANIPFAQMKHVKDILLFLTIVMMVLNSMRNAWVNYLNKRQKIVCLWLGMPLVAGAILFEVFLSTQRISVQYSASLATFNESAGLFLAIYLGMSFLSLLLHLPTAGMFDKKIREVESFQELSGAATTMLDANRIVKIITEKSSTVIESDAIWMKLRNGSNGGFRIVASENLLESELREMELELGNPLTDWIVENNASVIISEVHKDARCNSLKAWKKFGSILAVPVISKQHVLGILYTGHQNSFAYDDEDRRLLQSFANQAAMALENSHLLQTLLEKERFEQEIIIAQAAQKRLLPKTMPSVDGLQIDAVSIPANEVGGDYYDFFRVDGKLAIAVGDVSGKGANAAFYMAELKGIIEALSRIYPSPKDLVTHLNRILSRNLEPKTFISLIYAVMDPERMEMVFVRAGHCPLLFCSREKPEPRFFEPAGLGLGLDDGATFSRVLQEQKMQLHPGDVFLFYTDGVTEARNLQKKEFGEQLLKQVFAENCPLNANQIKECLVNELKSFIGNQKLHDDLTFVVATVV